MVLALDFPYPNADMSPEVTRREPYNTKADVFSFGVMMYEIFSRQMLSTMAETMDPGWPPHWWHISHCFCMAFLTTY